jgi:flagella basal body P-ring formation protein FlgA
MLVGIVVVVVVVVVVGVVDAAGFSVAAAGIPLEPSQVSDEARVPAEAQGVERPVLTESAEPREGAVRTRAQAHLQPAMSEVQPSELVERETRKEEKRFKEKEERGGRTLRNAVGDSKRDPLDLGVALHGDDNTVLILFIAFS